jgi:predicted Zn finger-like uncharacterized protein
MHIICPHCTTSYAIELATLGVGGRTVRCSRCKEVWLARPEDASERSVDAMVAAGEQAAGAYDAAAWDTHARQDDSGEQQDQQDQQDEQAPLVDSPSISGDWQASTGGEASAGGEGLSQAGQTEWPSMARFDAPDVEATRSQRGSWFRNLLKPPARFGGPRNPVVSLTTVCAAMGALVLALLIWRVEMVRLLPQTAAFYQMVGLDVNMRGLVFKDVKVSTETVEGKPVLVIEGVIVGQVRQPVELPRLRFSVRDAQGAEIYAWNAVLEQPVLKPGEKAWFKSRLASPPPEGRQIDVRFFIKHDLAGGRT